MTSRVFAKLFGLFVLLLILQTVVVEIVFNRMAGERFRLPGHETLWAGLVALAMALPLAAWVASRISARLQQVVTFARRIADGDLSARLGHTGHDEFSSMEAALDQTAERLGESFAEIESRRQELAGLLDSMQ